MFTGLLLSIPWMVPCQGVSLLFAFVPLMLAEDRFLRKNGYQQIQWIFILSFPAFLLWNLLSTWWVGHVSIPGMLLIVTLNALLMNGVWWLRHLVRRKLGALPAYFSLPVFWLSFEFLHHNWDVQWPWLTLGNGFANSVKVIQWYEFTGVLGGSLWILISNILIFLFIKSLSEKNVRKSIGRAIGIVGMVFIPVCWSVIRYNSYEEKGVLQNVVILQPNIDPYTEKFSSVSPQKQVQQLVQLANLEVTDSTDLIVAPETSLPEMWEDSMQLESRALQKLSGIFNRFPTVRFIGGAITQKRLPKGVVGSATTRQSADGRYYYDIFNSALMVQKTENTQINHKTILVSGVEKMPFQRYLFFIDRFILRLGGMSGSLTAGNESELFLVNDSVKIGSLICFESSFGEHTGHLVKRGASMLVVLTNDGWWRNAPGTWQHFAYSRLRAVETRRSIARSANTGISGFINQRGDVLKKSALNRTEALRNSMSSNNTITFYTNYGDYLGRGALLLSGLIVLYFIMLVYFIQPDKIK